MKYLLYTFLFVTTNVLFAQTHQLIWKAKAPVNSHGEFTVFVPSIQSDNNYLDAHNIPHYYHYEKTEGYQTLEIQNIRSEEVAKSYIGEIQFSSLPTQPTFWVKNMKGGKRYHNAVDMTALYRDGNRVYRIMQFDVVNTNKINTQRTTQRTPPSAVLHEDNGRFFKISVDTTGIYKIDRNFLQQNGIPLNFDARKFKVYGNGGMMLPENPGDFRYHELQENAIYAVGLEDGNWDQEDYVLFYAQGPNGIVKNHNQLLVDHAINQYEDVAYYFINFESAGNGKRIQELNITQPASNTLSDFDQLLFYEKDLVNIYNVGRQWFGEAFNQENTFDITFDGNGTISDATLSFRMLGVNAGNITFDYSVNGSPVTGGGFTGGVSAEFEPNEGNGDFSASYPLNINLNINNSSNPAGTVYLDYVQLKFKQSLDFGGEQLGFRWFQNLTENEIYAFNLNGNPEMVWDVSDRTNAKLLIPENSTYKFFAAAEVFENEFIAFNQDQAETPMYIGEIENQALASLANIDYVIVAYPDYVNKARELARVHEELNDVNTAVVTTTQVYNEFGSGSQDISAIRDFFKFLYDHGTLKYALLLGDGSYDFKDRIPNNTNRIPTYQSPASVGLGSTFVSDDFYAMLDDTDVGVRPLQIDIALGRLPAATIDEANLLVDKTLSYMNMKPSQGTPFGDWRTKVLFVVDDDNPGEGSAFHTTVENEASQFLEDEEGVYTLRKLYVDAFQQVGSAGGLRYPAVTDAIVNAVETGTLLVNYFGHGGINGWAQERIFTQNEIRGLDNYGNQFSRLPVFVTVTCDFTVWDIPQITSGGELLIKNETGGAVAMLTTSREIAVTYGIGINDKIIRRIFQPDGDKYLPLGEALRLAKFDYNLGDEGLSINLIGDPLLSLARPAREIAIETINGEPAATFDGTLRALDFVTIEGAVLNPNGSGTDTSFNGNLTATLFDKEILRTTLNNDGDIDELTYNEQVDAIYRGSTDVENGEYKIEFYVPKDINFNVGNGKLLLYTQNGEEDGMSYKNDILVGDINPDGVDDDEGPVVGLYMNNLNFANGGITDRNPYLLACVVDSIGINATGAGIGHDITQLLDGDINTTTVLNEFFEGGDASPCINPNVRDFQKGRVLYKLNDLELGEHTVTFRVWDINNNSTTETLDFIVMDNGDQQLYMKRLMNWPNPFTNQTYFHFEHNCPEALEAHIQVFTVSGKLVKTIRQQVSSAPFREGYRTNKFAIPWDGLDDFGNKIGRGVYIYKTTIKGVNPESCKGVVSETEKLVILK